MSMHLITVLVSMIDINLVNRKLVKPCNPTPQNLKNYKLSYADEYGLPVDMEVGILLFYAASEHKQIIKLEESLSIVLVRFYPLAGRYVMKERFVDCSDQGAEFIEAEAPNVELARLVEERNLGDLAGFFPRKNHQVDEKTYPLLSIQITEVKCGGVVIGISVLHKIFDVSSLDTFITAWSNASKGESSISMDICPVLGSSSMFPLRNWSSCPNSEFICPIADTTRVCVKRFTFDNEAIARLRSKLISPRKGNRRWSRVRVVSTFIVKALIGVERAKHAGKSRPCIIMQVANMRERTVPPLPEHSCGNLVLPSYLRLAEAEEMGIQELADVMSEDIDRCIANCSGILSLDEDGLKRLVADPAVETFEAWLRGEVNYMFLSDWSKCGFYEADFGWGEPVWASIIPMASGNGAVLMGNKDGDGIEAWLLLDNKDLALFEQDDQIRLLAT